MNKTIPICPNTMQALRNVDVCLMSYNIEMTEITGGTFWKAYSPEQIAGSEPFGPVKDFNEVARLLQVYDPINLYDQKLRSVRMSTARSGQMMPSQAPQRGRGTSNAGIVVLDKTTGEELDIVPKNAARATLRCETNSS